MRPMRANQKASRAIPSKWVIFPGRSYRGHGEINERLPKIAADFSASPFNPWREVAGTDEGAKIGIIAGGVSYSYAEEALAQIEDAVEATGALSPSYRLMQVGTPYPFPEAAVAKFAEGLDRIIVFEELDHVIEDELLKLCGKLHAGFEVQASSRYHYHTWRKHGRCDPCADPGILRSRSSCCR